MPMGQLARCCRATSHTQSAPLPNPRTSVQLTGVSRTVKSGCCSGSSMLARLTPASLRVMLTIKGDGLRPQGRKTRGEPGRPGKSRGTPGNAGESAEPQKGLGAPGSTGGERGASAGRRPALPDQGQIDLVDDLDEDLVGRGGDPRTTNSLRSSTTATVATRGCSASGEASPRATARPRTVSQAAATESVDCSGSWARNSEAPPAAAISSRRTVPSGELQCRFAPRSSSRTSARSSPVSGGWTEVASCR